jgi:Fe-S-cluster containining protein
MPNVKRFNLAVQTPDGDLPPLQIDVSDEPMRLSELVPLVHDLTDRTVGLALERSRREGKAITCKAGCGTCCRQLVPVAPAEVFYIVERILCIPLDKRRGPLERFEQNEKILVSTGLIKAIRNLGVTFDNNVVARDYFRLGLFCPFLENQSCSIHEWRPIACREYNVTSPAAHCADPFRQNIESVRLCRRISESFSRLCSSIIDIPPGMVPMPLIFDYFETYEDASRKTFPGIELFDTAVEFVFGKKM